MKKLFSLLLTLVLVSGSFNMVSADTFYGGRSDNGNISVFYTLSVRENQYYSTIYDAAIDNWRNISPNLSLTRTYSSENVGTFLFAPKRHARANVLGEIVPYEKNANGEILPTNDPDVKWWRTDVRIFTDTMHELGLKDSERISNATHEIGHTLKLAHPGQGTERRVWLPWWKKSVMNQGIQDI